MLKTLLALLLIYAGVVVMALLTADRQIFLPQRPSYDPERLPVDFVPLGSGGRVAVLHLPAPSDGLTLLFSHGNAEDLGDVASLLRRFHEAGFGVLAYDYRGYGASQGGPPTTGKALDDVAAVWRHATEALGIPPERLVAYGRSVGSGPATWLAANRAVGGLVIESGFTSAFRVVTRWPLLPFDRFPNEALIAEVDVPALILHGTRDRVIAPWHGRALHRAAPESRLVMLEGAGHNDLHVVAGEEVLEALQAFAEEVRGES